MRTGPGDVRVGLTRARAAERLLHRRRAARASPGRGTGSTSTRSPLEPDGSLLISSRSTWTVYDLDAATGQILWQAGGRQPSFTMGPGTLTAWQHDAQPLGDDSYSVFDNAGPPTAVAHSRGEVVRIDPTTRTASLVSTIAIPTPIYAETQGDLQLLPDGNWWIGWGERQPVLGGQRRRQAAVRGPDAERLRELPLISISVEREARDAAFGRGLRGPRRLAACLPQLERRDRRGALAPRGGGFPEHAGAGADLRRRRLRDRAAAAGLRALRRRRGARRKRARAGTLARDRLPGAGPLRLRRHSSRAVRTLWQFVECARKPLRAGRAPPIIGTGTVQLDGVRRARG